MDARRGVDLYGKVGIPILGMASNAARPSIPSHGPTCALPLALAAAAAALGLGAAAAGERTPAQAVW